MKRLSEKLSAALRFLASDIQTDDGVANAAIAKAAYRLNMRGNDSGWVCENHMDNPWGDGNGACDCGAGSACVCNPDGDLPEGFVILATTDAKNVKEWAQ